jgi:hypothetical protein
VLASLKKAGAGLQEVCDAALKTASVAGGTKGFVEDILKAPIEPIVNAKRRLVRNSHAFCP